MHMLHLAHILKSDSHSYPNKDTAKGLKVLAPKSIDVNDNPLSIQTTQLTEQIKLLDRQLFLTELKIANFVTCLQSKLKPSKVLAL